MKLKDHFDDDALYTMSFPLRGKGDAWVTAERYEDLRGWAKDAYAALRTAREALSSMEPYREHAALRAVNDVLADL